MLFGTLIDWSVTRIIGCVILGWLIGSLAAAVDIAMTDAGASRAVRKMPSLFESPLPNGSCPLRVTTPIWRRGSAGQ